MSVGFFPQRQAAKLVIRNINGIVDKGVVGLPGYPGEPGVGPIRQDLVGLIGPMSRSTGPLFEGPEIDGQLKK